MEAFYSALLYIIFTYSYFIFSDNVVLILFHEIKRKTTIFHINFKSDIFLKYIMEGKGGNPARGSQWGWK